MDTKTPQRTAPVRGQQAIGADRRREVRTKAATPVYVRPADPMDERVDEVRFTTDCSTAGLRFITMRKHSYRIGMHLYLIPTTSLLNFEYLGEVVRIESLPEGRYGISVALIRVGKPVVDASTIANSAFRAVDVRELSGRWLKVFPASESQCGPVSVGASDNCLEIS